MRYIETLLRNTFEAQGAPDAAKLAHSAVAALERSGTLNRWAIIRLQILADPETDWKEVTRKHHCSRGFVYKVWNERYSTPMDDAG
jgi:hypothetical protein